jgi:N-acyl-D-amino-acid deacylase
MASGFAIQGATVVDGLGGSGQVKTVRVSEGRIAEVGDHTTVAGPAIDATGLVLTPGFIDTHAHDDFAVALYPNMEFKVAGGVTTVVVGNCGIGAVPSSSSLDFARMLHDEVTIPDWATYADYFGYLESHPPSVNVACLIGHGTVRRHVMGTVNRAPSDSELEEMKGIITRGMEDGCVGMSTGLVYPPSSYAETAEIIALAKVISVNAGIYTSHIRDEGDKLLEAVAEAIYVGDKADVPVIVSHIKAGGKSNHGKVADALALIDMAGPTVGADHYPYTAGSTGLSSVVDGGIRNTSPETTVISSTEHHPDWHGKSLAQLSEELNVPLGDVGRFVLAQEPHSTVILHIMDESDVRVAISHPLVMVGSDGVPTMNGQPHPRLYGTFARILGRYVRDLGILSLEQAVHKMTALPASRFALTGRGIIREGAVADLVLFDPRTITDRGTYEDPHQPPIGIEKVWVNGKLVIEDGRHLGVRSGVGLRRQSR